MELSAAELRVRRSGFTAAMNSRAPGWSTAIFVDVVNQYYFTGTMQDGILFICRDAAAPGGSRLWYGVRRSYARALLESPLFAADAAAGATVADGGAVAAESVAPSAAAKNEELLRFTSYAQIEEKLGSDLGRVYVEGDTMTLAVLARLKRYFSFSPAGGTGDAGGPDFLDTIIRTVRSVKSPAELDLIRLSGEKHRILLEERVPALLREGMSEAEFLGELTAEMYRLGYQGLARFHQNQTEIAIGQIGFGTNALYPSRFDGPGGAKGHSPAAPLSADGERKLKKGDAVFVDTGFGVRGYHSDKTQVYFFGVDPPAEFVAAQQFCIDIQKRIAERLKPGEIPSRIFKDIMGSLSSEEADRFMGVDNDHRVKFLGHGVGLNIDDFPVIAKGFDEPLAEGMVLALEPKKGVPGIGLAGVEDTYIVTPAGGRCVTGGGRGIMRV